MISNIIITPNVFGENDKQNIISVLKDTLLNPIYLVDYQGGNWIKTVQSEYISNLDQKYRDKFQVLLKNLNDQKKFNKQTNHEILISSSKNWIEVSEQSLIHSLIDFVITTKELRDEFKESLDKNCESINDIIEENTKWDEIKSKRSISLIKRESYFKDFFSKFMPYSSKLIIVDPYFEYITKYERFLKLCSNVMGNRVGFPQNQCKIEIHTRFDNSNNYNFQIFLNSLNSQYNHQYKIFIWKDNNLETHKFHDRFLLTESIGFSVSHSFDIFDSSNQETTWTFLDKETYVKRISNFREEDPLFKLHNTIEI